jgi:NAD+ diphosphatase
LTGALWFAFRGDRLLVLKGSRPRGPQASVPEELGLETHFSRPVGYLDGSPCWAAEVPEGTEAPEGAAFVDLRAIFAAVDEPFFAVAGRAKQVVNWHATHRSCGRCGGKTESASGEMAMRCARWG